MCILSHGELTGRRHGEHNHISSACDAPYVRALAAHAMGSVLLAQGDPHGALKSLRQAWMDWQELEAAWEAGRVRVLLGLTCRALGDDDAAQLEFDAAERVFSDSVPRPISLV
jgi:hypothetical protein